MKWAAYEVFAGCSPGGVVWAGAGVGCQVYDVAFASARSSSVMVKSLSVLKTPTFVFPFSVLN
jgi:hypothetical protein